MSTNRRLQRARDAGILSAVSDPEHPDAAEVADLREHLAKAGAPEEVLRLLDDVGDVTEALQRLTGAGLVPSPEDSVAAVLESWTPLLEPGCDALRAELCGAEFLSSVREAAPDGAALPEVLIELVARARAYGTLEALAMSRVLAVLGPPSVRPAAAEAADALVAAGLADLPWAKWLGSPRIGPCFGYADSFGAQESIALIFTYGRKPHAVVVLIDHDLGGGVKDCFLAGGPAALRARYQQAARLLGMEFRDYQPAEADAILRRALGRPPCPVEPDQVEDVGDYLDVLRARVELLPPAPPDDLVRGGGRGGAAALDAAGQRAGGGGGIPTVYRVKIALRGARPPIWRRLEVPSSITLYRLHQSIQAAFGWADYHLWVFETPADHYGTGGRELGHRSPRSVKLSDVAAFPGDRIRYTYDFGDDWEHDITVEDVRAAEPGTAYPRCTAGRRACPPEDCGGVWGYQVLLEILADPGHPEHGERLEWLGLDAASDFDPAEFTVSHASQRLSGQARGLLKR
jgi:hypothetical protein